VTKADAAFRRLGITCTVCGEGDVRSNPGTTEAVCPRCRARFRSMHLASMLISEVDGGVAPTLARLAGGGQLAGRIILDFTGDITLVTMLKGHPGYRPGHLFEESESESWQKGHGIVRSLRNFENCAADVILFRDVLRVVPHLDNLLSETTRICRPGGTVIFQDRFPWPLPERSEILAELSRGELIYRKPPAFAALGKEGKLPIYRRLGADLIGALRGQGFLVHADRIGLPLQDYYREMALIAQKP
jgi:SAM-dependent methyltransferase